MGNIYSNQTSKEEKFRVYVSFPISVLDGVRELANDEGRSVSMQIVTMIKKQLQKEGRLKK